MKLVNPKRFVGFLIFVALVSFLTYATYVMATGPSFEEEQRIQQEALEKAQACYESGNDLSDACQP
jgi:hypothetical protein